MSQNTLPQTSPSANRAEIKGKYLGARKSTATLPQMTPIPLKKLNQASIARPVPKQKTLKGSLNKPATIVKGAINVGTNLPIITARQEAELSLVFNSSSLRGLIRHILLRPFVKNGPLDLLMRYKLVEPVKKPNNVANAITIPDMGSPEDILYPAKITAPWVTPCDGIPHSFRDWAKKAVIAIAVSSALKGVNTSKWGARSNI